MNKLNLRNKVVVNFGLNDATGCYNDIAEIVIEKVKKEMTMPFMDVKSAIEIIMFDFKVSNAPFYDELKPFYTEHYDLIPKIGIDNLLNLAVDKVICEGMVQEVVIDAINKAIAFDYAVSQMEDDVEYSNDLQKYLDSINYKDFYDIGEMYQDIDVALEVFKIKKEKPKKKAASPLMNLVFIDNEQDLPQHLIDCLKKLLDEEK